MDLGFETLKANWSTMLDGMLSETGQWAMNVAEYFDPVTRAEALINYAMGSGAAVGKPANPGLDAAKQNFAGVMGRLKPASPWQGPRMPPGGRPGADGSGLASLVGGVFEKIAPKLTEAKFAASGIVDRAKLTASWWGGVAANAFGVNGDKMKDANKPLAARLSGASQSGSAEAYSTIVQAMIRGNADPNVKATQTQTKQLVKAIKDSGKEKPLLFAGFPL